MGLQRYKAKRDFARTPEPRGQKAKRAARAPMFVIQKHAARRLHYDFRLAMDGVLKSWAVPKGIPTRKGERRLAVHVEDHPMDYARFEGIIPEGNYGAGTVMVWDIGTYEATGSVEEGKLRLALKGKKLRGEWTLVHMRDKEWLLIKSGEDMPEISVRADDRSALTGRSMKRIAEERKAEWRSDQITLPPGLPREAPRFIEPMKARLAEAPPKGDEWIYEIKWDGYRVIAVKRGKRVELFSRNELSMTGKYPEVAEAVRALPCRDAVLDGEVVALDANGRPSFQLMQNLEQEQRPFLFYYVFDLLNLEARSTRGLLLEQRKQMLQSLLADAPSVVRFSGNLEGEPKRLLEEVRKRGLEGLIAKRRGSVYEPGHRSNAWLKLKVVNEQEFVIGGYTPPKGTRSYFGAVLVGYYQVRQLMFASKVGTGFDTKMLRSLYEKFQPLRSLECPFVNLPKKGSGGLSAAEMRRCTWLKPKLVCQVRFTEWTKDGNLRHPVFLGLRVEKKPEEVVREKRV